MRKIEKEENNVKQIYFVIQIEGYKGTYSGVRTFVQNIRKDRKHNTSKRKGFIHLKEKFVCLVVEATPKIKKRRNRVTAVYTKRLFHFKGVYQTIQKYRAVVEARDVEGFLQWLKDQLSSWKQPFYYYAFRQRSDIQAVKNALTLPFSNGLLEGQINRLKTIKRMTYGRAGLALLEKRVLYHL